MSLTLQRLLTWLSPSFPIGAFSFSGGLEAAITQDLVTNRASLSDWLDSQREHGRARLDCWYLRAALEGHSLEELNALAVAQSPSSQLQNETVQLGDAMAKTLRDVWELEAPAPGTVYPLVFGYACRKFDLPLREALIGFLHAYMANQVSVACRVLPLGQTDGQRVLHDQEAKIEATVDGWLAQTLDPNEPPATATLMADYMAMSHETQYSRMFRS